MALPTSSIPIFYEPQARQGTFILSEEESGHCTKVLRKSAGDEILVVDGQGTFFQARIINPHAKKCEIEAFHSFPDESHATPVHLAIAPTKNIDRMEWLVEKVTEMGVSAISFIQTTNTERAKLRMGRLEKKAVSAMKQSRSARLPVIHELKPYDKFLKEAEAANKMIAYLEASPLPHLAHHAQKGTTNLILIGPEGDFTPTEIQAALDSGYQGISLSNKVLRTETAGMSACYLLSVASSLPAS